MTAGDEELLVLLEMLECIRPFFFAPFCISFSFSRVECMQRYAKYFFADLEGTPGATSVFFRFDTSEAVPILPGRSLWALRLAAYSALAPSKKHQWQWLQRPRVNE